MKQPCWKYALFCFHPKFDTGTWTIAAAFSTAIYNWDWPLKGNFRLFVTFFVLPITMLLDQVIFGSLFFLTLAFSAPKCLCLDIWEHIDALSTGFKVIYVLTLFFLLSVVIISAICIFGTFKAQPNKLFPYILVMIAVAIGTFAGSIFIFIQLAYIDQFLLFDNSTYWNLAKMVLKEDLIENLEGMWATVNVLLKNFLKIEMGDELNLNLLLDAALKDEVLILMGAGKRVMKISAVLMLMGINWLFITSIIVVCSHWSKLRVGLVNHFSPVPNLVLSRKIASNSYRSTESDTMSEDYSGEPLYKLQKMKSRASNRSSSIKSTKRLYDVGRLEVEEKFPKGQFL